MDKLKVIYARSHDLVVRKIEGELIIVPLTSGIGDLEDELFSLNAIGRDVWARIDGKRRVCQIVKELEKMYQVQREKITADVLGFLAELAKRKLILEESPCQVT